MKPSSPALEVRPATTSSDAGYPTADELGSAWMQEEGSGLPAIGPAIASALLGAIGIAGCGTTSSVPTSPAPPAAEPPATVVQPAPVATLAAAPGPDPAAQTDPRPHEAPPPLPPIAADAGAGLVSHAFSWEKSSLPIEWHPYGTGEPARLSEDAARAAVDRIFKAAGIALAPNVNFQRPGIACELDGYDAAKKVGYVFVSWQDLEDPIGFPRRGQADSSKGLSHEEMRRLMELEKSGQEHVIVISYQDNRFSWGYSDNKTEQQAIGKLEQALRSYVAWLRSQRAL